MGSTIKSRSVEQYGGNLKDIKLGNARPHKDVLMERAKRKELGLVIHKRLYKKPHEQELKRGQLVSPTELEKIAGVQTVDEIRARITLTERGAIQSGAPLPDAPTLHDQLTAAQTAVNAKLKIARKAAQAEERIRARNEQALREKWTDQPKEISSMTVSLYKSLASGAMEVVVQTNAQSLDIFITALADALHAALVHEASAPNAVDTSQALIAATLKNAFPVAYAISGYKADKVSESKLLTCGFASPDASELLAQSKT